jgi:hypothetical protein
MSTLRVDTIQTGARTQAVPVSELRQRVIKTYRNTYRSGSWTPSTAYQWAPNMFVDYTPASASSRIRFTICASFAHANGHAISHWIFYSNTSTEQGRHSVSGQSPEWRHTYVWDIASWGTTSGRIGYQIRNYGTSNQGRLHSTHHWDGAGSDQAAQTEIVIEEYLGI